MYTVVSLRGECSRVKYCFIVLFDLSFSLFISDLQLESVKQCVQAIVNILETEKDADR